MADSLKSLIENTALTIKLSGNVYLIQLIDSPRMNYQAFRPPHEKNISHDDPRKNFSLRPKTPPHLFHPLSPQTKTNLS